MLADDTKELVLQTLIKLSQSQNLAQREGD